MTQANRPVRVRFAPSPTGALHIGGVRTALYNYLWAKKHNGTFILRIEDTDQNRYVEGAEDYIMRALEWVGLIPDESPKKGGKFAPYRQSERKSMYRAYAETLVKNGKAYYAFDTTEELDELRKKAEAAGDKGFKYDYKIRENLKNSLTLSAETVAQLLNSSNAYVIRLKVEPNEKIEFSDIIRGDISYSSNELDDKVLLKGDGMPTYHLANVVDDYLMEISHVIRGEEWLPSTPTHVLLYRAFGWEAAMPEFAHLPLILRPDGKGKLSKRDGAKFGMPVFPLDFTLPNVVGDDAFIKGFREWGFEADAVVNFLALLGWSGVEGQEFYTIDELIQTFDPAHIHKTGARFDFDKAKWFNQQYLMRLSDVEIANKIRPIIEERTNKGFTTAQLALIAKMLKERVHFLPEFYTEAPYFYAAPDYTNQALTDKIAPFKDKDIRTLGKEEAALKKLYSSVEDTLKKIRARWDSQSAQFETLCVELENAPDFKEQPLHDLVFGYVERAGLKTGDVLSVLRFGLSATIQGASVFEMMQLFEKEETLARLRGFFEFVASK